MEDGSRPGTNPVNFGGLDKGTDPGNFLLHCEIGGDLKTSSVS